MQPLVIRCLASWMLTHDTTKSPTKPKEVQSLAGRVAALNMFISNATKKCHPFFKTLKKDFEWIEKCEVAFQQLKQ